MLSLLKELKNDAHYNFEIMVPYVGELDEAFSSLASLHYYYPSYLRASGFWSMILRRLLPKEQSIFFHQKQLKRKLKAKNFDVLYFNSLGCNTMFNFFKEFDGKKITHVHELGNVVAGMKWENIQSMIELSHSIISSYRSVSKFLVSELKINHSKLFENYVFLLHERLKAIDILEKKHIIQNSFTIGGCGKVESRKGTDLFVEFALRFIQDNPQTKVQFKWVGDDSTAMATQLKDKIRKKGLSQKITFTGKMDNPEEEFINFDLFFLSSREEAFGIVGLENAYCGNPLISFDINGDLPLFIETYNCGFVIPRYEYFPFSNALKLLIEDPHKKTALGSNGKKAVIKDFNIMASLSVVKKAVEA